ncbi:hypothetical protein PIB30_117586 [Stylosanthes scabra]|nr:hypothetical protein [Stylosanthes scabra]
MSCLIAIAFEASAECVDIMELNLVINLPSWSLNIIDAPPCPDSPLKLASTLPLIQPFGGVCQGLCQVDEECITNVGMTFLTIEEANDFYKEYAKQAGFATKIRNSNKNKDTGAIKNQLIMCSREGKRRSNLPEVEKTNPMSPTDCPARIYVHIKKNTRLFMISKVVLEHSHPCSTHQAQMLPQHRQLRMHVRRVIDNNDEAGIRPRKIYQSLVAIIEGREELNFIEKDVRNHVMGEVCNISEEEDAKELGKYFLRMKEQNPSFFFSSLFLMTISQSRMHFGLMQGVGMRLNILVMLCRLTQLRIKTSI